MTCEERRGDVMEVVGLVTSEVCFVGIFEKTAAVAVGRTVTGTRLAWG